jgi:cold shock CspA family protein
MRVVLYTHVRMYGFCKSPQGERAFFHLGAFAGGHWPGVEHSPPPLIGEEVRVFLSSEPLPDPDKAPKATLVERISAPVPMQGTVESFQPQNGWGFAKGDDGISYYLHRSEVLDGRLPLPGQRVFFFAGQKQGRPRACCVQVGETQG